ncbi:MAG: hypothetical protein A2X28_03560 [Elusimicrobia bacterium GWA2_56_46]|nr:MAG: hypothetical protein A2X28_03560 [Elusimicrobia bacterium GWA2_56_46]OGR54955.1 MAG: hypothetical protein A2X39_02495 [Elusimicrobia bacterium GWC2_56_31]
MTPIKSRLSLNRLVVFCKGSPAYDEKFHSGVNIIRGENSSGKSTIADFIFYVLGGDFKNWKPEAAQCDVVLAEVEINGIPITIRREITKHGLQPMAIFPDTYAKASASSSEGWLVYPYKRSAEKDNFSHYLFDLLKFPEIKTELESMLTMHQILRMLYVDQLTPPESIMRNEQYDYPSTRKSIGDLLLGVYDDSIYTNELTLREKKRLAEELSGQYKNISDTFRKSKIELDLDTINKKIKEAEAKRKELQAKIDEIVADAGFGAGVGDESEAKRFQAEYVTTKQDLETLRNSIHRGEFDFEDSKEFLASLESRREALANSMVTAETLGEINLTFCPKCLLPLPAPKDKDACCLCNQKTSKGTEKTQYLKMQQELVFQIKESRALLGEKESKLVQLKAELPVLERKCALLRSRLNEAIRTVKTERNKDLDVLLVDKGSTEAHIEHLYVQAKTIQVIENFRDKSLKLKDEIERLNAVISQKKKARDSHLAKAYSAIDTIAGLLLKKDLNREETFSNPKNVVVDFERNSFRVNDRNQFSASSIIYLKNCIHFAMFFASAELDFFRYPRFILCDNIEDKGMEEVRSQNFQRCIVELSVACKSEHQIIFTTSMIDPTLDNTAYCVGKFYTQAKKTLKIQ